MSATNFSSVLASVDGVHEQDQVHPLYKLVFIYVEPALVLIGAYLALFHPETYLLTVHALPSEHHYFSANRTTEVLLAQLANVYVLFPLLEHKVLRTTSNIRVWRAVVQALLVADLGHLAVVVFVGIDVNGQTLGRLTELGVADWAKPVVMAAIRIALLLGVGVKTVAEQSGSTQAMKTR